MTMSSSNNNNGRRSASLPSLMRIAVGIKNPKNIKKYSNNQRPREWAWPLRAVSKRKRKAAGAPAAAHERTQVKTCGKIK